jgi:hypothetical protein
MAAGLILKSQKKWKNIRKEGFLELPPSNNYIHININNN